MNNRRGRLQLTCLEARDVPANFRVPWADPTHLTLSFAPDGTNAAGLTSQLDATLGVQMTREVWQATILDAAQAWANVANVSIGLVADGGENFGIAGADQGDARFGDIRIGALPMSDDALGEAVEPDPLLSGTLAGDIFFNSTASFTRDSLYRVALHEIGHALGLAPSTNSRSVMFNEFTARTTLASVDETALRGLYGNRTVDEVERGYGNDNLKRATRLEFPSSYDGETPLIAYGTLIKRSDVDVFELRNPSDYGGSITIRLQTSGISLLAPRLTVLDEEGRQLARLTASGSAGDTLTYTLPEALPGGDYFIRVDSTADSTHRIGRYGLAVTFDDLVEPTALTIDDMLRGPYDALEPTEIARLFVDPNALFEDEANDDAVESDNTADEARDLEAIPGPGRLARFTCVGSISDAADVDFYRVRAPRFGSKLPVALTITLRNLGLNGTLPSVQVYDQDMNLVPTETIQQGNGKFTMQAVGIESRRRYFFAVEGSEIGNYAVEATFRSSPIALTTFASGNVDATPLTYQLYVARTQLFGFTLATQGNPGAAVRMTITNEANELVFDLIGMAGQTISALSTFLAPGEYTVAFTSVGSGPVSFRIRGSVQSDPLGPQRDSSVLAPKYENPAPAGGYLYPGNRVSKDPYLWFLMFV